jgi:hypothetical protein
MTAITLELNEVLAGRINSDPHGIEKVKAIISREFCPEEWQYETSTEIPLMSNQELKEVIAAIDEADAEEGDDLTHEEVFARARENFLNRKKVA